MTMLTKPTPKFLNQVYDIFSDFDSIDRMFDRFANFSFPTFSTTAGKNFFEKQSYPKVDVKDYDSKIVIESIIPGLSEEDLDVYHENDVLIIEGKKQEKIESESEEFKYIIKELKNSSFKRCFPINSEHYNIKNIKASFKDGNLSVEIPKLSTKADKRTRIKLV